MTDRTAAEVICCPAGCEAPDNPTYGGVCHRNVFNRIVARIHSAGLMIVPRNATLEMKRAANKSVAVVTPYGTWALGLDEAQRAYRAMTTEGELK